MLTRISVDISVQNLYTALLWKSTYITPKLPVMAVKEPSSLLSIDIPLLVQMCQTSIAITGTKSRSIWGVTQVTDRIATTFIVMYWDFSQFFCYIIHGFVEWICLWQLSILIVYFPSRITRPCNQNIKLKVLILLHKIGIGTEYNITFVTNIHFYHTFISVFRVS